ncbi:MAG: response regulator transcription factor [Roseivirga sp.]|nr:response regulator transcription factor [Roseivirga sp.]
MAIRTIIVDDEPQAREGLELLLSKEPDFAVVAICKNGIEAIEQIDLLKPDLVFLDVQMPKVNGFEVLNSISWQIPYVIFATAYDQYAVKAFEMNAQDYLLKPFSNERFAEVLALAKNSLAQEPSGQAQILEQLVSAYLAGKDQSPEGEILTQQDSLPSWNKLTIKNSGKISFVDYAEIHWIEGYDYCIKVHTQEKSHVVRASLKEMETKLQAYRFVRVSKSAIVNMIMVKEIEPYFNNELMLTLSNQEKVKVSRSYRPNLKSYL